MSSSIDNVCVDCATAWELATFCSAVPDRPIDADAAPGDAEVGIPLEHEGDLIFLTVPYPEDNEFCVLRSSAEREATTA